MDAGDEVFKSRQVDEYNDYADAVWISKYRVTENGEFGYDL